MGDDVASKVKKIVPVLFLLMRLMQWVATVVLVWVEDMTKESRL